MTPQEIEALIQAEVRKQLRQLFSPIVAEPETDDVWVDASTAYKRLGFPSINALYEAINKGLLRLSDEKHEREVRDRRAPGRKKPRYQFHIANCQRRLRENPEKRRAV